MPDHRPSTQPEQPGWPRPGTPQPMVPRAYDAVDPLEDTREDLPAVNKRPKPGTRGRRLAEVAALVVLLPGLLIVQWLDDSRSNSTHDRTTTVRRGGTVTVGHTQWRLLGKNTNAGSLTPGAVSLTLLLQVQPVDAEGVKEADPLSLGFRVRDRDGRVWSAGAQSTGGGTPAVGRTARVTITADVPERLADSVVLEMCQGSTLRQGPKHWFRFAN